MPPTQQNPYDFIMSADQRPRRSFNLGDNKGARFVVIAVLLILIFIITMLVMSFLDKDKNAQKERLIEIAQTQTEIIRVSSLAEKDAKSADTRNFAVNTKLSVQTSQSEVSGAVARYGVKGKGLTKELSASKNPKTDAALQEASRNNRFDETFMAIMEKQLADYQKLLLAAHKAGTPADKQVLQKSIKNANVLNPTEADANIVGPGTSPTPRN